MWRSSEGSREGDAKSGFTGSARSSSGLMLRITEEVLLLIIDSEKGGIQSSLTDHSRDVVIAGAVLTDLALEGRIDTDLQQLIPIDPTPLGDNLLDPTLADIFRETDRHDTAYWVTRTAARSDEVRHRALGRLVMHGILETAGNGMFFLSRLVSRVRRYPPASARATEDVEFRIMRMIFSQEIPEPRDAVIIGLAAAGGVFERLLSQQELADAQERIEQIAQLDLIGRTVAEALRQVTPPTPRGRSVRPFEEIPQASGWPLLGNALAMAGDLRAFLTRQFLQHGPVFRLRALDRRYVALVGPEANVFVTNSGQNHFRSFETWRDFNAVNGGLHTLMSMDGPEHLRMRKVQAEGYSPKLIEGRLADVVDITRRAIAAWPEGKTLGVHGALQKIVAEQIGVLLTGTSPRDYLDDLAVFLEVLLKTQVTRQWPARFVRLPRFRRACTRVRELYGELLSSHDPEARADCNPDYVDSLVRLHRTDPQFFPETDMMVAFLGPYLAGLDTSATVCSFMLHALGTHPELHAQMTAEADGWFDRGALTAQGLRQLDVTHRIALETLRMYPLIPAIPRVVANGFEFGGYEIPAGSRVLIGNTVAHHLPEYFPEPERFDIERYTRERAEHHPPGVFAPFGVGRHRCLGSGFAEVQIAATMATIVREMELTLERPERPLKIRPAPLPHPAPSFRLRVVRRRRSEPAERFG